MGLLVLGISFSEDTIELEYTDDHMQTEEVAEIRRLYLNREVFFDYIEPIHELIGELVDEALVKLRNPPARLAPEDDDVE